MSSHKENIETTVRMIETKAREVTLDLWKNIFLKEGVSYPSSTTVKTEGNPFYRKCIVANGFDVVSYDVSVDGKADLDNPKHLLGGLGGRLSNLLTFEVNQIPYICASYGSHITLKNLINSNEVRDIGFKSSRNRINSLAILNQNETKFLLASHMGFGTAIVSLDDFTETDKISITDDYLLCSSKEKTCLAVSSDKVYLGQGNKLFSWKDGSLTELKTYNSKISSLVTLEEDVLVGTENGKIIFNDGELYSDFRRAPISNLVSVDYHGNKGVMFNHKLGKKFSAIKFQPLNGRARVVSRNVTIENVSCFSFNGDCLYFVDNDRLFCKDNEKIDVIDFPENFRLKNIKNIIIYGGKIK